NLRQPAQLARILVHLAPDLALAPLQLLLQGANLAVPLQELPKAGRANDFELALALQQRFCLDLETLGEAPRMAQRTRRPATASSALGARLAPQPFELDPDRAPPILQLEVLRDVFDRHLAAVPHPPDVGQLLAHVGHLEDRAVAADVDAAPAGAAHELCQLASGEGGEVDAVKLGEGGNDDPARRHVDAQ